MRPFRSFAVLALCASTACVSANRAGGAFAASFAGAALPCDNPGAHPIGAAATACGPSDTAERIHALEAEGRLAAAIDLLRGVARRKPDSADVFLDIGRLSDRLGRRGDALDGYRRFVALVPGDPHGHELLGWMELESQHADEALSEFRAASRLAPPRASVLTGTAWALSALGRHEEAIRAYADAVRLDPDDATSWGQMAIEAEQVGRERDAVSYWERALRAAPGYFDSRVGERARWERAVATVGPQPPATVIAEPAAPAPTVVAQQPTEERSSLREAITHRGAAEDGPASSGSGFFVTRAGMVITNKHVVRGCSRLRVRADSTAAVNARVVAVDQSDDLALLQADESAPAFAMFRGGREARPGDDVVAVGFPLNGLLADQVNVSTGSINALAGMYNDAHTLQMSAPVQPGSSGGPLFDGSGNVVGVVVTKLNAKVVADAMGDIPQNVNFALKASVARQFLDANGVRYETAPSEVTRPHADIGDIGRKVTVLIECWR